MDARRVIGRIGKTGAVADLTAPRADVRAAKVALGERGPVWWNDGAPDLNRHMTRNTIYSSWFAELNTDSNPDTP